MSLLLLHIVTARFWNWFDSFRVISFSVGIFLHFKCYLVLCKLLWGSSHFVLLNNWFIVSDSHSIWLFDAHAEWCIGNWYEDNLAFLSVDGNTVTRKFSQLSYMSGFKNYDRGKMHSVQFEKNDFEINKGGFHNWQWQ